MNSLSTSVATAAASDMAEDRQPTGTRLELSFGYPANPETLTWPKRKGRKELAEVVHWERW